MCREIEVERNFLWKKETELLVASLSYACFKVTVVLSFARFTVPASRLWLCTGGGLFLCSSVLVRSGHCPFILTVVLFSPAYFIMLKRYII